MFDRALNTPLNLNIYGASIMNALKIFRKTNKLTLLRMRVYQGVRNSSFSENSFIAWAKLNHA